MFTSQFVSITNMVIGRGRHICEQFYNPPEEGAYHPLPPASSDAETFWTVRFASSSRWSASADGGVCVFEGVCDSVCENFTGLIGSEICVPICTCVAHSPVSVCIIITVALESSLVKYMLTGFNIELRKCCLY